MLSMRSTQNAASVPGAAASGTATAAAYNPSLERILEKLLKDVRRRSIFLDEALRDYDQLNCGVITSAQFRRALATLGVSLTDDDYRAITSAFAAKRTSSYRKHGMDVQYTSFLQALRQMSRAMDSDNEGLKPHHHDHQRQQQQRGGDAASSWKARELAQDEEMLIRYANSLVIKRMSTEGMPLRQPFRDFDPLRHAIVTKAQFERSVPQLLHSASLGLPVYEHDGKHGQTASPLKRGGEQTGGKRVSFQLPSVQASSQKGDTTYSSSTVKGSSVAAALDGSPTEERFTGLPAELTGKVVQLLKKKYATSDGMGVNYQAWCDDVEEQRRQQSTIGSQQQGHAGDASITQGTTDGAMKRSAPSASTRGMRTLNESGIDASNSPSAAHLMEVLKYQSSTNRLRCEDYFRDFDRRRIGLVTPAQFASVLGRLTLRGFSLANEHIDTLAAAYTTGMSSYHADHDRCVALEPCINYVAFLADLVPENWSVLGGTAGSSPYHLALLSSHMSTSGKGAAASTTQSSSRYVGIAPISTSALSLPPLSPETEEQAEKVLQKVKRVVMSRRIFLKPVLHDFDRAERTIHEHRTCTASRFERALSTHKINLSPTEVEVLVEKYRLPQADGAPCDEVDYYSFMLDVDPSLGPQRSAVQSGVQGASHVKREAEQKSNSPAAYASDMQRILESLARQAAERELRIDANFADFNPLRDGVLQSGHFVSALSVAGFRLQDKEWDTLVRAFQTAKLPNHVDTAEFLKAAVPVMNAAASSQSLKRPQTRQASTPASDAKDSRTPEESIGAASNDNAKVLAAMWRRLGHIIRTRQLHITPFFADCDRHGRLKISATRFQQCLSRYHLSVSADELKLLRNMFACQEDDQLIDARAFIRAAEAAAADVHPTVNVSNANRTAAKTTSSTAPPAEKCTVEDALETVCSFLQQRQARLSEFFPDGDELRHGKVSHSRFRHCLTILGIELSEEQLEMLERAYADPASEFILYHAFLQDVRARLDRGVGIGRKVDRKFAASYDETKLRADLSSLPPRLSLGNSLPSRGGAAKATIHSFQGEENADDDGDAQTLVKTLTKVQRAIHTYRTEPVRAFEQYDRMKKGHVQEAQFFSALVLLGIRVSPEEARVLNSAFSLGDGRVNYIRFLNTIYDC